MRPPSLQLVSGLPSDECLERISEGIDIQRSFAFSFPSSWPPEKPVSGTIKGEHFCLWKAFPCNSFHRLLEGRVRPYRVGTLIEGRFSVHPALRTFAIVQFGLMSLITIVAFIALAVLPILGGSSPSFQDIGVLAFLLLCVATGCVFWVFLWRAAGDDPRFLEAFLIETLQAEPWQSDDCTDTRDGPTAAQPSA